MYGIGSVYSVWNDPLSVGWRMEQGHSFKDKVVLVMLGGSEWGQATGHVEASGEGRELEMMIPVFPWGSKIS